MSFAEWAEHWLTSKPGKRATLAPFNRCRSGWTSPLAVPCGAVTAQHSAIRKQVPGRILTRPALLSPYLGWEFVGQTGCVLDSA
jgi:hypothetical protein